MSVTMSFVRQCSNTQIDVSTPEEEILYEAYTYIVYEAMFTNFEGTTRTKLKRFRTIEHLFAYVNRLHVGRWMSDVQYEYAWRAILKLSDAIHMDVTTYGEINGDLPSWL